MNRRFAGISNITPDPEPCRSRDAFYAILVREIKKLGDPAPDATLLTSVAAAGHVIHSTRELQAKRPRHDCTCYIECCIDLTHNPFGAILALHIKVQ